MNRRVCSCGHSWYDHQQRVAVLRQAVQGRAQGAQGMTDKSKTDDAVLSAEAIIE